MKKPVVLIGLMGSGKSRIGALLSERLSIPFVDADREIEKTAGCTIAEIFSQKGEPAFRALERETISGLMSDDIKVIATGGGAVMNAGTASAVFGHALTIWLDANIDVLERRTARGGGKRPLLNVADPRGVLIRLLSERRPVYARADIRLDTSGDDIERTMATLLSAIADNLESEKNL